MIKIKQINKSYNKGKKNEINAIKNTTLEFPNKGLVVLFGPSGSGKTTLLNILGGLEYVDSGEIIFDEFKITKLNRNKLDLIRNQKIGYVFQSYNLLPNMTVYQNIEFVLKMLGIKDQSEIQRRIEYVLEAVGMLNYRKRKVSALSGGQQQRIGIARAIAKNPDVIIADEPTGNLDSRNTIEVMNMIKKIAEQKLVILVTHERSLATFYGDRIIEIKDGMVIKDQLNTKQNVLDIRHNNTVYLKDLEKKKTQDESLEIEHYFETSLPEKPINVTLVSKDGMIYVRVEGGNGEKIRYIDDDSEVKLLNENYKGIEQTDVIQTDFNFNAFCKGPLKKGSVIHFKDAFNYAFQRMKHYSKLQKLMFLGFVFSAMIIAVAIALIGRYNYMNPEAFQQVDKHYILTDLNDPNVLLSNPSIKTINPIIDQQNFNIKLNQYYQMNMNLPVFEHPSDLSLITKKDIIIGRYPENKNEIVIDQMVADTLMNDPLYKQSALNKTKELLNLNLTSSSFGFNTPLKIVGISDTKSPTVYMDESYLYQIAINNELNKYNFPSMASYEALNHFTLLPGGKMPTKVGEVLYPEKYQGIKGYHVNSQITDVTGQFKMTIVGFYTTTDQTIDTDKEVILTSNSLLKATYYQLIQGNNKLLVYSTNIKQSINFLHSKHKEATYLYDQELSNYKTGIKTTFYSLMVLAVILLSVSLLQLYFIIRSSLITRIYEIGVYRSLGATRWDIYKLFIVEIVMVTTFTSLIGYIIATLIIKQVETYTPNSYMIFYFPFYAIMIGIVVIYAINVLSGLFPIYKLIRKSPSQILKQYDA